MIDENSYLITAGFAIYSFEGIGIVMPIMQACEKKEQFHYILTSAISTLVLLLILYSELCYFTWGSTLTEPIVMEMLPKDVIVVILTKIMFIL